MRASKSASKSRSAEVPFESGRHSASLHGFSRNACPQISACSTHRREKLCRYIARPALVTFRLSMTSTGRVLYKLKRPFRDGTHSVLMEPLALLERLAVLTPRPCKHLRIRNWLGVIMAYQGAVAEEYKFLAERIEKILVNLHDELHRD